MTEKTKAEINAEKNAATAAKKEADKKAKADAKAAKEAQAAADKAAKAAAAVKPAAEAKPKQPEQNGVRRPGPGGACGDVWKICDELSAKAKAPVTRDELIKHTTHINEATVRTQYANWKKFYGISVPRANAAPAAAPVAPAA